MEILTLFNYRSKVLPFLDLNDFKSVFLSLFLSLSLSRPVTTYRFRHQA
jgi:hypothetical protein